MPFTGISKYKDGATMTRRGYMRKALCLLAGPAVTTMIPATTQADDRQGRDDEETFTIDAALDGATLIVNHVDPTQPPDAQLRGDTLVIDGTIYRGGTLPSGIADNDPNAPGGIGKITCRALVLVPLSDVTTPAATFVTELYSLPNDKTIIADGPGANLFATVYRAVLGGTQGYESASGQLIERNLGTNSSHACNLRITFKLNKSGSERHW